MIVFSRLVITMLAKNS